MTEQNTSALVGQVERPIRLSPLNLSGLIDGARAGYSRSDKAAGKRKSAMEIVRWGCPECGDTFDEDEEQLAEDCCQGKSADDESSGCPVCEKSYVDHREAADCCLWKDIDAITRYRIADAVAAGSSWAAELGIDAQEPR